MSDRGNFCNAAVANPELTVRQLEQNLEVFPTVTDCPNPDASGTALANNACGADAICNVYFIFIPNDTGLCGTGVGQGCAYMCQVRVRVADFQASSGSADTPICASQWYTKKQICIAGFGCFG